MDAIHGLLEGTALLSDHSGAGHITEQPTEAAPFVVDLIHGTHTQSCRKTHRRCAA
jgi:hypothetical protein